MAIEFKNNVAESRNNGAKVVIETLSVVDGNGNIYLFDIAGSSLEYVEKFIADGCPGELLEEYGGYLQL